MRAAGRWPLHPRPAQHEALSCWVDRLARLHGLSLKTLMRHNLGSASALADGLTAEDLDWDPPAAVLAALAERTGMAVGELGAMTIAGWVPWLLDTLDEAGQDGFDTYVRQHSVLLTRGAIPPYRVAPRWASLDPRPTHSPVGTPRVPGLRAQPGSWHAPTGQAAADDQLRRARLPAQTRERRRCRRPRR